MCYQVATVLPVVVAMRPLVEQAVTEAMPNRAKLTLVYSLQVILRNLLFTVFFQISILLNKHILNMFFW